MEHTTGQFLARGGVTIFTQTWMPEDPSALVVLSHGFGEHSGRYGHVAEALTAAGFAVAALDHRGHGRSGGDRALVRDMAEFAADFALFRQQLADVHDLPQILLGHSMGAAVVLEHLRGDHDAVQAVVLSAPYLRNAAAVPLVLRKLAPVLGQILPKAPTQKLNSSDVSRDPAVVAAYDADPLVYHGPIPAGTGACLLAVGDRILPDAGRITEPMLIVHGEADRLASVEGARELARTVGSTDVELTTYPGLYHEVFNEPEQDVVIGRVVDWITAHA
jgi:alpha-beta hydrolase superfamily lysophospholipase